MLAVLSPAKSLNLDPVALPKGAKLTTSEPTMMDDASSLMATARGLSQKRIRELMGLSADLAKLNYDRYRSFEIPFTDDNALPAALMFNGDVYKGLDARSLKRADLKWAQDRIAILSGLFGLLRPLDLIQPHRMEMGTRLKTRRGTNLYNFWGERIRKAIAVAVANHQDPTLVNLASNEYFKAAQANKLKTPVVQCAFYDYKDGKKPNVISFMAKRARGLMARFIIEQRIDSVDGLRDFSVDRYRFEPKSSSDETLVFGRKFVSLAAG